MICWVRGGLDESFESPEVPPLCSIKNSQLEEHDLQSLHIALTLKSS